MNVAYRSPNKSDVAFIMATWLNGQRNQGDRTFMTNTTYYAYEQKRIERILSKCMVVVLCDPNEPTHVFGYLAYSMRGDIFIAHYAHLKKAYRRLGLMSALLSELCPHFKRDEVAITHINKLIAGTPKLMTDENGNKYWGRMNDKRVKYRLKFNPYLEELI